MNKALLQLADLAWPKVLGIALLAVALYYFALRDDGSYIISSLQNQKQELDTATKQLQSTKRAMENAEKFEAEIKAAKLEFERVNEFMPPRLSVADLTTLIADKSAKSGVRLQSTAPKSKDQTEKESKTFFSSLGVTFKVEGSFNQILDFLSLISKDSRMLTFENAELTKVNGSPVDDPTLSFNGELKGYRFRKEAMNAPAAGGK